MNPNEMRQKLYDALSDLLKINVHIINNFLNKRKFFTVTKSDKLAKEKFGTILEKKSAKDYIHRYIYYYNALSFSEE